MSGCFEEIADGVEKGGTLKAGDEEGVGVGAARIAQGMCGKQ